MKGQMDIAVEPLDIAWLEQTWKMYMRSVSCKDSISKLNLSALMGEQMGDVLQEIRMLRTQVKGLQVELEYERQEAQDAAFDYMFDEDW